MADSSADTRVNLAALKRVDPYAIEIVETGTQVAIYKFNSQSNEWEKTDIEGTLFLYARSGDPKNGFIVMNRLSTENLVEPITRDLEIQEQAPFLLYKNSKNAITGVWFYEELECKRIAEKLISLIKGESTRRRQPASVSTSEKSGVDILSLLTKAQGEYEQKGKVSEPVPPKNTVDVVRPTAVRPTSNGISHSTSLSVAELFATESVGPVPMPLHHGGVMFERLLSATGTPGTPGFVPPPSLPNKELHTAQNLERELRSTLKVTNGSGDKGPLPHASPVRPIASSGIPGGLAGSVSHVSHPQVAEIMQSAAGTPPRNVGAQSAQAVPLMSPMMFASAPTAQQLNSAGLVSGVVAVESHAAAFQEAVVRPQTPVNQSPYVASLQERFFSSDVESQVTPLTKAQLLQAFNHLLKNDPNFITQLHDAYVQSLKQSLKVGP